MFDISKSSIIALLIGVAILFESLFITIIAIVHLYQKKQLLHLKTLEELKAANLKLLVQTQLAVQHETFKAISKEITSTVGQRLTLAKLNLINSSKVNDTNYSKKMIGESLEIIKIAIEHLRDASKSMSADIVTTYGIVQGIECEMEHIKYKKHKLYFTVSGTIFYLTRYDELVIFRIVQEALTNVVKHSAGNEINIKLIYNDRTLKLEIKDNGLGFIADPESINGNGVTYIRKRTRLLSGTCKFSNDSGAKVEVEIPALVKYEKGDSNIHSKKLKLYTKPIGAK